VKAAALALAAIRVYQRFISERIAHREATKREERAR
jgi:hypothetical protein